MSILMIRLERYPTAMSVSGCILLPVELMLALEALCPALECGLIVRIRVGRLMVVLE
jgi:hypothetical protein